MTESRGLLLTHSGEIFATGSAAYHDTHPDLQEPLPGIYVEFQPEGTQVSFIALLDTGGHYCILNTEVIDKIGHCLSDSFARTELWTAQGLMRGELYLHRITLIADQGDSLGFDATVFVSSDWRGPCFIGYTGALDRFSSAIRPWDSRVYFGPLSWS